MKSFTVLLILFVASLGYAAAESSSSVEVQRFVRQHGAEKIVSAAEEVARLLIAKKEVKWPRPLDELKPVRAYRDRVNLVVVVGEAADEERGLYIVLPESSYIPKSDDVWTFTPNFGLISCYRRAKKPNQAPEPTHVLVTPRAGARGAPSTRVAHL